MPVGSRLHPLRHLRGVRASYSMGLPPSGSTVTSPSKSGPLGFAQTGICETPREGRREGMPALGRTSVERGLRFRLALLRTRVVPIAVACV